MKKYKKAAVLFAVFLLAGCSRQETRTVDTLTDMEQNAAGQDENEKNTKEIEEMEEIPDLAVFPERAAQDEEAGPLLISTEKLENRYEDGDRLLARVLIDYPVIDNRENKEGLDKINRFFEESAQARFKEMDAYASDAAEAMRDTAEAGAYEEGMTSLYQVASRVTYNKNGFFSIVEESCESAYGMPYQNAKLSGYVFRCDTGEQLDIRDILLGSEEDIAALIGDTFLLSEEVAEEVKKNYEAELRDNTRYTEFYLDEQGLCFVYNPDTAAGYAEGEIKASIPLAAPDVFKIQLAESEQQ